ncbi:hypothetical protein GTY54_13500 [Streptomyces sp. SID625]|nr:hypothetical protein [Streptomyces sp. SID625]
MGPEPRAPVPPLFTGPPLRAIGRTAMGCGGTVDHLVNTVRPPDARGVVAESYEVAALRRADRLGD